jgi:hypothetical protein
MSPSLIFRVCVGSRIHYFLTRSVVAACSVELVPIRGRVSRKVASCPSGRMFLRSFRRTLHYNLTLNACMEIFQETTDPVKIGQKYQVLCVKTCMRVVVVGNIN